MSVYFTTGKSILPELKSQISELKDQHLKFIFEIWLLSNQSKFYNNAAVKKYFTEKYFLKMYVSVKQFSITYFYI